MSYFAFHLVFILPPILALGWTVRGRWPRFHPQARLYLGLVALIALVYTTPWDNYLVARGVWGYGAERVVGVIGYVPVEEYLFFLLQPVLVGLWLFLMMDLQPPVSPSSAPSRAPRVAGVAVYLALAAAGLLALRSEPGTYLGLILAWAGPVLAGQWGYAGAEIWARRRLLLLGVAAPTLYLWVVDAVAIRLGIWSISPRLSTGLHLLGLPVEEAVFFLATTLLVVQGLLLFLFPPVPAPSARLAPATDG